MYAQCACSVHREQERAFITWGGAVVSQVVSCSPLNVTLKYITMVRKLKKKCSYCLDKLKTDI